MRIICQNCKVVHEIDYTIKACARCGKGIDFTDEQRARLREMEIKKKLINIIIDKDNKCAALCPYHDLYDGYDYDYHEHCILFDKWNCYNSYDNPNQIDKRNEECLKIFSNYECWQKK